jgi:solute carrier family 25 thiamine pyrophosphate transporter 19
MLIFSPSSTALEETVRHMTILGTLASGALSGIAAKTLVYPLDVAKKRMQIQNMEEMRAPHFGKVCFVGPLYCLSQIH